jgi:VIT1/CCC1 family predicted Fe2+/Mn2+ transporter
LLEKQLELRKYAKTIHNSLDAVRIEKVKVQDEIEFAHKKAAEEHEFRLQWEKEETERLAREKKFLEEEAARRKEDEIEEMRRLRLKTLQATCKEDKVREY